ncbi:MAG: sugar ABC transporter permease [bacterium]|nr:sugar ABC transporter permease [bacterium]MDE0286990.1 sugar ABC transporter permease [bacterium]MDE0437357.1 sugar ABC transporter permease [bacterium]
MWALFALPAVALSAALLLYPFLDSARISLLEWTGAGPGVFVGLDNYSDLVRDPVARLAIRNTVVYSIGMTIGTVGVGGAIALAIDRRILGSSVFKFLIFLPVLLPIVFTSLVWAFFLDGNFGGINDLLAWIHPSLSRPWLGDPATVNITIILVSVLQFAGFPMVILIAALRDIPRYIHEAATIDGVSALQRVRHISIPYVRDVIATITLIQFMFGFRVFDQVFVMTRGGPGRLSEVAATFVWREAFVNRRFGYATAQAIVTSLVIAVLSMVYLTIIRTKRLERAG